MSILTIAVFSKSLNSKHFLDLEVFPVKHSYLLVLSTGAGLGASQPVVLMAVASHLLNVVSGVKFSSLVHFRFILQLKTVLAILCTLGTAKPCQSLIYCDLIAEMLIKISISVLLVCPPPILSIFGHFRALGFNLVSSDSFWSQIGMHFVYFLIILNPWHSILGCLISLGAKKCYF